MRRKPSTRPAARPRAFTMLEMLVALAIVAVVAGSLYATLHTAFRARRSATEAVARVRAVEAAMAQIQADLASAVRPVGLLAGPMVGEPAAGPEGLAADVLSFYATVPAEADPARYEAGALADGATAATGEIVHVEYALVPPSEVEPLSTAAAEPTAGLVLVRRVTRNLLAPTTPAAEEEVLCRGVRSLAFRYFDGLDWLDAWDSTTQDNRLPAAVEVTLALEPAAGAEAAAASARASPAEEEGYTTGRVFLVPLSDITPGAAMEVPLF